MGKLGGTSGRHKIYVFRKNLSIRQDRENSSLHSFTLFLIFLTNQTNPMFSSKTTAFHVIYF